MNIRGKNNASDTSEKPKKRRTMRQKLGKRARVAREEARPTLQIQNTTITVKPGGCESSSCGGPEAGCIQAFNNKYHYCVCTSNGELVREGVTCPRSTVPLDQRKPIHNVIPPQPPAQGAKSLMSSEIMTEVSGTDSTVHASASVPLIISMIVGCTFLSVLCLAFVFVYFKKRNVDGKVKPRVRPGEPLLAERYITNPQYGVCGAGTVASLSSAPEGPAAIHASESSEHQITLLDRSALTFIEEVGEGCFGKVHKGVLHINSGEKIVAIKVLKESAGRTAEEDFFREVSIMSAFLHPNILSLIGVVNKDDSNGSPWMIFEYMEWGDLAGVLRGSRGGGRAGPTLAESALLHIALQVGRGMQYLASKRFVHRDLAARNCLVGANLAVKIADFGMSRDVYTCDYYKMGGERPMPVRWMSPESIVYARFTHESDVWSYGVVLWEIYSRGKQPYYGCNNDDATKRIINGILLVPPEDCPQFACRLMRECWATDPRNRIGFDEICRKLEVAAAANASTPQIRLPRPPPPPQDSTGYLIPTNPPCNEYLKPLPDLDPDSETSEDEDIEDYT